ncbi:D-alanine--D-alanine ligase [soil metagenome]
MHKKIRVGVLFGGRSAEHEVSLQSAVNVIKAIDKEKYEVVPIGITKEGQWMLGNAESLLVNADNPETIQLEKSDTLVALIPDTQTSELFNLSDKKDVGKIDVIFPVLHGTYGEDGTMQGLLKLANVPFVGAGVLGSAVGMDKDVMKRLLRDAGIPVAKFLVMQKGSKGIVILGSKATPESLKRETFRDPGHGQDDEFFTFVKQQLGLPFFVKPANLGSSVGVSKVHNKEEFSKAVNTALQYDTKIIIEEFIKGREVECAVLGNEEKIASIPGELIISHEFYDYNAKYIDPNGAKVKIPADLTEEVTKRIQELAIKTCDVLCCEGMARVDCFVTENNAVYVNEINTIPGFTNISMYPKMWEAGGVSQTELVDRLIQLAIERFEKEKKLKTFL